MPSAFRPLLIAAAVALAPTRGDAHNLIVQVDLKPHEVRVEAGFDDDTPAQEAVAVVRNAKGYVVADGRTDEKGVWTFPRPVPGAYIVRVEYIGHDKEVAFAIPDESFVGRFASWQPDKAAGAAAGVALVLGVVLAFQWRRRWRGAGPS